MLRKLRQDQLTVTECGFYNQVLKIFDFINLNPQGVTYSGITCKYKARFTAINMIANSSELVLAQLSKHLCPSLLISELARLTMHHTQQAVEIYITHLKPGEGESIMQEIAESHLAFAIQALKQQQEFHL